MPRRFMAVVLASLLTAGLSAAPLSAADEAEAPEATGPQVGWLCQGSFERGTEADPSDPSRFDDAIRSCVSADEWLAAAAGFPEAFAGIGPVEHFMARCSDADAGLAPFAACQPFTAPSPDEDPDLEPTTAEPADASRVIIVDAAGGLRFDDADAEYLPVPRGITAYIPGAWDVEYFTVRGDDPERLMRSLARESKRVCGDHAWGCVKRKGVAVPKVKTLRSGKKCWVDSVTWQPYKPVVHMPRWETDALVHQEVLRWWAGELAKTAAHHARHIEIDEEQRSWFQDAFDLGMSCKKARESVATFEKRLKGAHGDFHAQDGDRRDIALPELIPGASEAVGRSD